MVMVNGYIYISCKGFLVKVFAAHSPIHAYTEMLMGASYLAGCWLTSYPGDQWTTRSSFGATAAPQF